MNNVEMVHEFMTTYGQDTDGNRDGMTLGEFKAFRRRLVEEELDEMDEAGPDFTTMLDAGLDILYFSYGTLLGLGFTVSQVQKGMEEVHRSNMSKLGFDGKPIFREDGKVLKGPNYSKPDLKKVVCGD